MGDENDSDVKEFLGFFRVTPGPHGDFSVSSAADASTEPRPKPPLQPPLSLAQVPIVAVSGAAR